MNSKKIKSIKIINEKTKVYSPNIENNHNYFSTGKLLSKNCLMILDEAQNADMRQLMMYITRMGKTSRVVIAGDVSQYDIKINKVSLPKFIDLVKDIKGVNEVIFEECDIVRAKILREIVKKYEEWKAENNIKY